MSLRPNQVKIAAFGLAGVAVLAGYVGIIHPDLSQRSADQAQTALVSSQVAVRQQAVVAAGGQRSMAKIKRDVTAFSQKFPASYGQEQWLASINAAARAAGVQITDLSASPPTTVASTSTTSSTTAANPSAGTAGPLAESKVTVSAKGSTAGVGTFLGEIETARRPLVVSSVTLNSDDSGTTASIEGLILLAQTPDSTAGL